MSKATRFAFQAYLCIASLNDLHGYSVVSVWSLLQLPYWCGLSELSHLGVLGHRFSGVAGDGKASLTAVILRCLLTLETKNSFLSLPKSQTTLLPCSQIWHVALH